MSFTDGTPQTATYKDCFQTRWGCRDPGVRFRCGLCGHKFVPGDYWRFLYTNGLGGGPYSGNPLVCKLCDGPDVIERWKALCDEACSPRFWRFVEAD